MLSIRRYFKPKRAVGSKAHSYYHDLALGLNNGLPIPKLLKLCLHLGLRDRALRLIESYDGPLSCLDLVRLALMRGDIFSAKLAAFSLLASSKAERNQANGIATLMAAVDSSVVYELACAYPGEIICSAAVKRAAGDGAEWASVVFPKMKKLGPDGLLLDCNAQTEGNKKQEIFSRYMRSYGLSNYFDPINEFSFGIEKWRNYIPYGFNALISSGEPLVSVIVAVHNCEDYIKYAIRSLLNQSYKYLEVLIVDDASTDNTINIAKYFSEIDPRVRVVSLKKNVGTYEAKNFGLEQARGEFVAFQDGDDWSHPQRLEVCMKHLAHNPDLVSVSHLYVRVCSQGKFYSPKVWPYTRWTPNSVFFRRDSVMGKSLQFQKVRFGGDSEFVARLKFVFGESRHLKIQKPLMFALHRQNSLMSASDTGLDGNGYSRLRTDYHQLWSESLLESASIELGIELGFDV